MRKIISSIMLVTFLTSLITAPAGAQLLPVPGTPVTLSAGFQPPVLLGLKIHPENPLLFDFIVDQGVSTLSDDELKLETEKLVKYFLAALTIPDKEVWVNLSPYEKDRIIPDVLGQTVMGKTMLEQDYLLKQLAASLTNPDTDLGKKYWGQVNSAIGSADSSVIASAERTRQSLNKVWIVPAKAEVLESNGIVLVGEKKLKVMMSDEYEKNLTPPSPLFKKAGEQFATPQTPSLDKEGEGGVVTSDASSGVFRSTILPAIEKEVNEGKTFADVRQIYNSVILAAWYKKALKESLLGKIYADKGKVVGVETDDKEMKQRIYEQYLAAFKKGVYNLIKEESDSAGEMIPRKYFSGGIQIANFAASSSLVTRPVTLAQTGQIIGKAGSRAVRVQMAEPESPEQGIVAASAAIASRLLEEYGSQYGWVKLNDNDDTYVKTSASSGVGDSNGVGSAASSIVRGGNIQRWLSSTVAPAELNVDMFRDYDYRNTGPFLKPEMVFRLGLVWADMALEKAQKAGITDRRVLLARDARKIEPELIDALVAALRYRGLDVIYIADQGTNSVTSYSWAVQQINPLMSIFITASHVSQPENVIVRGFKVAMLKEKGGNIQSMSTSEIKGASLKAAKEILAHPENIQQKKAENLGTFTPLDITENVIRFNSLVGRIAAVNGSLYELAKALKSATNPLDVLQEFESKYPTDQQPLKGMKIVVEGSHTESGKIAAATFEKLGAEVVLLHGDITEVVGEHKADPSKSENRADLEQAIKDNNATFGIAFDLDGDRGWVAMPERSATTSEVKFVNMSPDNAIVALLPHLISNLGYNVPGTKVGVIRDVLGTYGVNDATKQLGATAFQTDAGYVFLKALKEKEEANGFVFPIYGERSGHTWLNVSGEIENPLSVAILFATMVKQQAKNGALNPAVDVYRQTTIPYAQSERFMPVFYPSLLQKLSDDPRNTTGWEFDSNNPERKPPAAIISLGKDYGVKQLQGEFTVGKTYKTPAGTLTVREFNAYQDIPEEGGLYRFADIVFDLDGTFAGRFVFRASSNDPAFVASYEAPGREEDPKTVTMRQSVAGLVLDFLVSQKIAVGTLKDMALALPKATDAQRLKAFKAGNMIPIEQDYNAFLLAQGKPGVASSTVVIENNPDPTEPDLEGDGEAAAPSGLVIRIPSAEDGEWLNREQFKTRIIAGEIPVGTKIASLVFEDPEYVDDFGEKYPNRRTIATDVVITAFHFEKDDPAKLRAISFTGSREVKLEHIVSVQLAASSGVTRRAFLGLGAAAVIAGGGAFSTDTKAQEERVVVVAQGPFESKTFGSSFYALKDGPFNLTGAKVLRLTFPPEQGGVKFFVRLLPQFATPDQDRYLNPKIYTVPEGGGFVDIPISDFPNSSLENIRQISFHSGRRAWEKNLDQDKTKQAIPEKIETIGATSASVAVDANKFTKGGIDFDPANMNLQIKRDGKGVPLPLPQQNLEQINIQGLVPIIINIVPINAQNLPIFLGQAPKEPGREPELAVNTAS